MQRQRRRAELSLLNHQKDSKYEFNEESFGNSKKEIYIFIGNLSTDLI